LRCFCSGCCGWPRPPRNEKSSYYI
jgi:hypothetical protein